MGFLRKSVLIAILFVMFLSTSGWSQHKSLLLALLFDEGTGDVAKDASRYGNNGNLIEGPKWVEGKKGKALFFEEGNYVEIKSSKSLHEDIFKVPFTLLAWIKPTLTGDTWQHILRSVGELIVTGNDTLFVNTDGRLSWRGYVGGIWTVMCETAPGLVNADQWTHVTVVGDRKIFKIFVNGKEKKEDAFQETVGGIEKFCIGFDGRQWSEKFSGVIDEFLLVSMALLEREIKEVMEGASILLPVHAKTNLTTTWGALKSCDKSPR
jgi:hypothetical protein